MIVIILQQSKEQNQTLNIFGTGDVGTWQKISYLKVNVLLLVVVEVMERLHFLSEETIRLLLSVIFKLTTKKLTRGYCFTPNMLPNQIAALSFILLTLMYWSSEFLFMMSLDVKSCGYAQDLKIVCGTFHYTRFQPKSDQRSVRRSRHSML